MGGKVILKTKFLEKEIAYDGSQLSSHWILKNHGLGADAIVAFCGPCRVDLSSLVDLEDVLSSKPIYSKRMLHFIVEHFDDDLTRMILRQRLLMSLIQEELVQRVPGSRVVRRGDDLFDGDRKLTVSIATASPVSCLIHAGINIISAGTPVPTKGLEDFGIEAPDFGKAVLKAYDAEMAGVAWARAKVRAVP